MKKENVIKKYREFQEIMKLHHSYRSNSYTVYYRKKDDELTRIGILVGKRNGIAVTRNKIKRQVRMIIDSVITYNEKIDIVVAISSNYDCNKFDENKNELTKLLNNLKGDINE